MPTTTKNTAGGLPKNWPLCVFVIGVVEIKLNGHIIEESEKKASNNKKIKRSRGREIRKNQ